MAYRLHVEDLNVTVTDCGLEEVLFSQIRPILFTGERYRVKFWENLKLYYEIYWTKPKENQVTPL